MMHLKKNILALSLTVRYLDGRPQPAPQRPSSLLLLPGDGGWPLAGGYGDMVIHRPAAERYDLHLDSRALYNVAAVKKYKEILVSFRQQLQQKMQPAEDPRAGDPHTADFDQYPYYGTLRKK